MSEPELPEVPPPDDHDDDAVDAVDEDTPRLYTREEQRREITWAAWMFPGAGALLALPLLALWLASLARERAWLVYGVVVLVAFVFAVATSRGKRFLALRAWLLLAAVVLGVAFGWFAVGVAFGVFAAAIFAVLAWGRLQRARALPLAAASEGTGIQR